MSDDNLKRVVALATLLTEAVDEIAQLEEKTKAAKARKLALEREDLPLLMAEIGLTEFKLTDGSTVIVRNEVDAGISEERRPAAFAWLVKHGFGGLIKTEVSVAFDRGAHDDAVACAASLSESLEGVALKEVIAAPTLKAFVKEQMEAGNEIPMDLFGVFPYSIAKVQPPKVKKAKATKPEEKE